MWLLLALALLASPILVIVVGCLYCSLLFSGGIWVWDGISTLFQKMKKERKNRMTAQKERLEREIKEMEEHARSCQTRLNLIELLNSCAEEDVLDAALLEDNVHYIEIFEGKRQELRKLELRIKE